MEEDETKNTKERTEIIYGAANVLKTTMDCLKRTQERWDICSDEKGALIFDTLHGLKVAHINAMNRGVKLRLITEITKDNLFLCKRYMHYVNEMRHIEGVVGLYATSDKQYLSTVFHDRAQPVSQCIFCNVKSFVKQQGSLFDNLWKVAIPANQVIEEIEEEMKPEFVLQYNEISEIMNLILGLIISSKSDLCILISPKMFKQLVTVDVLESLIDASKRNVSLRMLIRNYDRMFVKEISQIVNTKDVKDKCPNISVRYFGKSMPSETNQTIIIRDNKYSLVVETLSGNAKDFGEVTTLATYSNNQSAVWTSVSLFERYWAESELKNAIPK
jgi:two-component system, OmpR family, sensor histidine kinase VicK